MKEYQIILDIEPDTNEKSLDLLVGMLKDYVENSKCSGFVSDIYWDEV